MMYLGDYAEDYTGLVFFWNSNAVAGASITRATNGTISVYKDGGTTQSTAGVTDTEDFDSLTGVHKVAIDLSADAFYAAGSEYAVVLSGATIDGVSINAVIAHFSIERSGGILALAKGANGFSAIKTQTAAIETDTQDIQSRLPAALVSGRMDSNVQAMANNVITAAVLATDCITSDELASSAITEIQSGLATAAALDTVDNFLDTEVAAIKAVTDKLDDCLEEDAGTSGLYRFSISGVRRVWDATLTDHLTAGTTGYALNAASSAGDPWSTALPGAYSAGSAGYILGTNLNATITSRASQTSLDTLDDYVDSEVAAIKTKTDQLTFGTANRVDCQVFGMENNTVTAAAIATGAVDADAIADNAIDAGAIATGAITNTKFAAGAIDSAVFATGAITAASIAADAIGASELAADAVAEIQSGLATAASLSTVAGYIDTEVAAIKAVTDKLDDTLEEDAGTSGLYRFSISGVRRVWDATLTDHLTAGTTGFALNAAGSAGDPWGTAVPGAYGAGTAGYILGTNLNATISSRASQTSLDTVDDFLDTEIAAIKAKTDSLTFTTANRVDCQVYGMEANTITATAIATDSIDAAALAADAVAEIQSGLATASSITTLTGYVDTEVASILAAVDTEVGAIKAVTDKLDDTLEEDAGTSGLYRFSVSGVRRVWDATLTDHLTAGSTGFALNAAGSAGDPWSTALPGAYGAGSAGYIIGTNINATISSRASQTSLDTVDDFLDTEVAAILAAVDTEVAAIKTKTDSLTFTTANRVDCQVYGMEAGAITASAIATGAIDADAIADNAIDAGAIATGAITNTKFAAGAIDATAIATDAIDAAALAADAITEIQSGMAAAVWASATRTLTSLGFTLAASDLAADTITAAKLASDVGTEIATAVWASGTRTLSALGFTLAASDLSADTITAAKIASDVGVEIGAAVWNTDATSYQTQGTFGQAIGDPGADTDSIWALVNTNLNATISSRASQTSLDTLDDYVDSEVAAIKAKTDQLTFSTASRVDSQVYGMEASTITSSAIASGAIDADALASDTITAAKIASDAITAAKIASDAITAAKIAADAITAAKIATGAIDADAIASDAANEIADALLDRSAGVETNRTLRQALRLILAACAGKLSGAATNTVTIRDTNDGVNRITASVDADGNRTAVSYDAS